MTGVSCTRYLIISEERREVRRKREKERKRKKERSEDIGNKDRERSAGRAHARGMKEPEEEEKVDDDGNIPGIILCRWD